MEDFLFHNVKIFALFLAIFVIVENIYKLVKIMFMEEGKFEMDKKEKLAFMLSFAYICTLIVTAVK